MLDWFAARREADGIASSTQKRTSRKTAREHDKAVMEDAFAQGDDDDEEDVRGRGVNLGAVSGPSGRAGARTRNLMESLPAAAAASPSSSPSPDGAAPGGPASKPPTVVTMSKRDLAALRSSLPSPRKHTGQKLAQDLGIKTGAGASTTVIGDLQFVEDEQSAQDKLKQAWRYREGGAGGSGSGARRLRLKGASSGKEAKRGGRSGAGKGSDEDGGAEGSEQQ